MSDSQVNLLVKRLVKWFKDTADAEFQKGEYFDRAIIDSDGNVVVISTYGEACGRRYTVELDAE